MQMRSKLNIGMKVKIVNVPKEANNLQDKFGIVAFVEDDSASVDIDGKLFRFKLSYIEAVEYGKNHSLASNPSPSMPSGTKEMGSLTRALDKKLVERLASEGFLRSYVDYASRQTDAPKIFHLATGLVIIEAFLAHIHQ